MNKTVRTLKHIRGPVGQLIKWLFIGFNLLMLFWLFSYWTDIAPMIDSGSSAEQAGAAIGSTIGTGLILMVWGIGAVVLGIPVLLTKGKLVEIEKTVASSAKPTQASQDTASISEAAIQKQAAMQPEDNDDWRSKLKSASKLTLQAIGFILFFMTGLAIVVSNLIVGLGIMAAGALLLPTVQKKLENTPLKTSNSIGVAMLSIVVIVIFLGSLNSPSGKMDNLQKKAEQAQVKQQDLREKAETTFAKNTDQGLQEISTYAESKNWWMVKTKTELLLGTDNAEIKRLYDEAVAALAKEKEDKQKQAEERLISEFKEKRTALITDLKNELANGNYGYAKRIGIEYIVVADNEFKKLHDTAVEKQTAEAAAAPWSYSHRADPMSKGITHTASLSSSNTVKFDFPYGGAQNGRLILRTDPKYGKDIIFKIEKGQILCPSYDKCTVRVRFDDENATSYTAVGAADNSTETIFISNYSRFVGKMMKAKRVRISMNIYQEGSPVFDFDVSGFNVVKYKPKI